MKKVKIVSLNFDFKVKIAIVIAVFIAVIIIAYSFYNICIENGLKKEEIYDIQDFININSYEASYEITVNSNKNTNVYHISENVDILNNSYNYIIDNELKINISNNEIKISKTNIDYEYFNNLTDNLEKNNFTSFSSIIEIIKRINNKELEGSITKVEVDENIIYKIHTNEDYIKKIKDIELVILKKDNKITEIRMYNSDKKEQYYINVNNFVVKK